MPPPVLLPEAAIFVAFAPSEIVDTTRNHSARLYGIIAIITSIFSFEYTT